MNILCFSKLERVENKRQYTQFVAQKQDVEQRMNSTAVTKELFHGTSSDICEQIYKSGFDRGYAGKHGESNKKQQLLKICSHLSDIRLF